MANYKVTDAELISIANAIRTKGGTSASMVFPSGFVSAVQAIPTGQSFSEADEGKVVFSGALSAQGIMSVSENSVYDTTLFSQVSVAIPAASLISKTISENGTYYPADDGADAFSQVVVDVSGGGGGIDKGLIEGGISEISDSIISRIASYKFQSDSDLTFVSMANVSYIGQNGFYGCTKLSHINFPNLGSCSSYVFNYTIASEIEFPNLEYCGFEIFNNMSQLNHASLPKLKTVENGMFQNDALLATVYIPECGTINTRAFSSCKRLTAIDVPKCSIIRSSAFYSCTSLSSVNIEKCISIFSDAFFNCTGISSIKLLSINTISGRAFYNCANLFSLYVLTESVPSLATALAFAGTPISTSKSGVYGSIYVLPSMVDAFKSATAWSEYANRITAYSE